MNLETQFKIKTSPLLDKYIKENSYWYKYLNRDSRYLKNVEEEAKEYFKVRLEDKIKDFSNHMESISTFLDLLK